MKRFSANELTQIAAAGGGFYLSAHDYSVPDLTMIASAASGKRAPVTVEDCDRLSAAELTQIGAAGKGAVTFLWR